MLTAPSNVSFVLLAASLGDDIAVHECLDLARFRRLTDKWSKATTDPVAFLNVCGLALGARASGARLERIRCPRPFAGGCMAQPRPKCCAKVVPILTAISHSAAPEAQLNESSEGESKQAPQGRCRRGIVQEAQGKDYRTSFTSGSVVFGL